MSEKRRDKKGRILRTGESQRPDGRYSYAYTDAIGARHFVYSWRLEEHDKLPSGKRECVSLRAREREIANQLAAGLITPRIKVYDFVKQNIESNPKLSQQTKTNYNYAIKSHLKDAPLGNMQLADVKYPHIKKWITDLKEEGLSYQTINSVFTPLRTAFKEATVSDMIARNPADFALSTLVPFSTKSIEAIPRETMNAFLEFVKNDNLFNYYYDAVYILFHTGLRISELCGLTISDVDFAAKTLTIDHQLSLALDGKLVVTNPKTEAGNRIIPLNDELVARFDHAIKTRHTKVEQVIDGHSGFIFLRKRDGKVASRANWNRYLADMWKKFGKSYDTSGIQKLTPHVCRHTYCTNLIDVGIDVKTVQYLMGHSNISTTLGIYTTVKSTDEIRHELDQAFTTKRTSNGA